MNIINEFISFMEEFSEQILMADVCFFSPIMGMKFSYYTLYLRDGNKERVTTDIYKYHLI